MQLKSFFRNTTDDPALVSAQEAGYVHWRHAGDSVAEAYRGWAGARGEDRWLAYAAYQAALDREEDAASTYQRLVER